MHLSAKGAYVAFRFGSTFVQAGAGALDFSASAAFVGPPILLGVGVAAAVYFIPWDRLLKLLGGLLRFILELVEWVDEQDSFLLRGKEFEREKVFSWSADTLRLR